MSNTVKELRFGDYIIPLDEGVSVEEAQAALGELVPAARNATMCVEGDVANLRIDGATKGE